MESKRFLENFVSALEDTVDNAIMKAKKWKATHFNEYMVIYPVKTSLENEIKYDMAVSERPGVTEIVAATDLRRKMDFFFIARHYSVYPEEYIKRSIIFESYAEVCFFRKIFRFITNSFQFDLDSKVNISVARQKQNNLMCYSFNTDKNSKDKDERKVIGCTFPLKGELSPDTISKLSSFYDFLQNFRKRGGF